MDTLTLETKQKIEGPAVVPTTPALSLKARAVRNAIWNWLGVGAEMLVAIFLTPFLIRRLGDSTYGTWIVIGSLTGYLGILDFGLRGAVGRYVALYNARQDSDGVLQTLNTAGCVLAVIGTLGFGAVALLAMCFDRLVEVPQELLGDARLALLIVGCHLALFFVLRIFDAALWGFQRFDLLNMVDIPAAILRGVLSATVVTLGFGLVGLACVTLVLTVTVGVTKAWLCWRVRRNLRLSPVHVRLSALRELWGYGVWNFLMSLASMARSQLSPTVVGAALGLAMVTPFSIVMRLIGCAGMIVSAGTGVLTPVATAFHAQDTLGRQRRLFIESGKMCTAAAVYFYALFVFLGQPLLELWIGPNMAWAWQPLVILATGELLPMSVAMAENTILGMARNRSLAFRGAAECVMALGLATLLGRSFGLNGVCAGLAISATCWRGVFMLIQAAALVEVRFTEFFSQSFRSIIIAGAVPVSVLGVLVRLRAPESWLLLWAYTAGFTVAFASTTAVAAFGFSGAWTQLTRIRQPSFVERV